MPLRAVPESSFADVRGFPLGFSGAARLTIDWGGCVYAIEFYLRVLNGRYCNFVRVSDVDGSCKQCSGVGFRSGFRVLCSGHRAFRAGLAQGPELVRAPGVRVVPLPGPARRRGHALLPLAPGPARAVLAGELAGAPVHTRDAPYIILQTT